MAKRRLTHKQKNRIKQRQHNIGQRWKTESAPEATDEEPVNLTGDEERGLVIAHYGTQLGILTHDGLELRCHKLATVPDLVAGDRVIWRCSAEGLGVIITLLPRTTELKRTDNHNKLKLVAANVDTAIIVFAPKPAPSTWLLDTYLVAAKAAGITPILLLNKYDLAQTENTLSPSDHSGNHEVNAFELLERYRSIGFDAYTSSTKIAHGLDHLTTLLESKSAIFAGQSGVGKSSLINALLGSEAKVGELSTQTGLGRHTTVMAQLYSIPTGGHIIDSPGIRDFSFTSITRDDIAVGFPDIDRFLGQCKFRDCAHHNEPGCALIEAIQAGEVAFERAESFKRMMAENTASEKGLGR